MVMSREAVKTPGMAQWLEKRCQDMGLSYRQAAKTTKLSHATIASIIKGDRPSAATINKIAKAFGINGQNHVSELEDELLTLCGYRSAGRKKGVSLYLSRLLNMLGCCDNSQLNTIESFINYSVHIENGHNAWRHRSQ